ncbi:membrane protein insertion efficiency factor YidD [Bacteroides sp. KG123]|uniref:membrane protein insertion efficiency factor YidD n=1 Tax=unclassified Bacteroides TaxID=2646097 RepID=UPI003D7FB018
MMRKTLTCIILLFTAGILPAQESPTAAGEYIRLYQKYVSPQKNGHCAMYPSCSAFGHMVFKERPFFEAVMLVTDRMMRCSHDAQHYETASPHGYRSLVDYPYYHKPHRTDYPLPGTDMLKRPAGRGDARLFINHLINRKEYHAALLEIERVIFSDPHPCDTLYAQKLLCHRATQSMEKGIFEYETEFPEHARQSGYVGMQAAMLYYIIDNHPSAASILDRITEKGDSGAETVGKAYTLKGIMEAASSRFAEARQDFAKASSPLLPQNLDILKQMERQKKKSPLLARLLSIVPGGGYLYTGHKGSALTALVINSLLGYAAYTSIRQKNYGVAGLCGFLSLSFYIGNINGAGRSALRYNRKKHDASVRQLESLNNIFIN